MSSHRRIFALVSVDRLRSGVTHAEHRAVAMRWRHLRKTLLRSKHAPSTRVIPLACLPCCRRLTVMAYIPFKFSLALRFHDPNFRKMISGSSCHSSLLTHILLNVLKPAKILPPIHVVYLRSGGAVMRIFMSLTARVFSSLRRRSPKPFVSVLPPERMMLLKSEERRSRSVRVMEVAIRDGIPGYSSPRSEGVKRTSGARNRGVPILIFSPSGSVYVSVFPAPASNRPKPAHSRSSRRTSCAR